MNAIDFLKTKTRICEMECTKCPLSQNKNDKNVLCGILQRDYPEQAVEIVEKWAKENPPKTQYRIMKTVYQVFVKEEEDEFIRINR